MEIITIFDSKTSQRQNVGQLPNHTCTIYAQLPVHVMVNEFKTRPGLPGVILIDGSVCLGSISRSRCFENLGRPFGLEVHSKRPVVEFLRHLGGQSLLLLADTLVDEAVKIALNRPEGRIYEPIIIQYPGPVFRLLDMHTLLLAQTKILEEVNRLINRLATTDQLTEINNRRGFFELAQRDIERANQDQRSLCVLMVDIDHFKAVNDCYGHNIGDQMIRAVADQCQRTLRQSDLLGRYGGEEFVILLPDSNLECAQVVAERLRYNVEHLLIESEKGSISVTVSIGLAQHQPQSLELDALLQRADQAMYLAKQGGRNRIHVWHNALPERSTAPDNQNETGLPPSICGSQHDILTVERAYDELIDSWTYALELRDKETRGHTQRVADLTVELGYRLGFSTDELVRLRRGALLHDIGKIAIPDYILLKPGKLNDSEWATMRRHPQYAYDMLYPIEFLRPALDIPYGHHERWDGSGYPRGLRGEAIPLEARLFAVVDVWDALNSDRPYRRAWQQDDIRAYLREQAGIQFDPRVVQTFLEMIDDCLDRGEASSNAFFWMINQQSLAAINTPSQRQL